MQQSSFNWQNLSLQILKQMIERGQSWVSVFLFLVGHSVVVFSVNKFSHATCILVAPLPTHGIVQSVRPLPIARMVGHPLFFGHFSVSSSWKKDRIYLTISTPFKKGGLLSRSKWSIFRPIRMQQNKNSQ